MFRVALSQFAFPRALRAQQVVRRWYQVGPNSAKPGMVIDHNGSPQIILSKDHGGTGRGQAVIKLNLKHAVTGARSTERFRNNDTIEVMQLVQNKYQFLYTDDNKAHLLNMETFEELTMDLETFEGGKDKLVFLEDGMDVVVQLLVPEPGPVSWRLPPKHTYKVKKLESRLSREKGTTYVPATLENGARVSVPDFIKPGESVVVNLDDLTYVGRG